MASESEISGTLDPSCCDDQQDRADGPANPLAGFPTEPEEDSDWKEFGQAMKERSQERRANNRFASAKLLVEAGISFDARNNGGHLIVRGLGQTFDFWPGTGLWQERGTTQQNRGVHALIARCTPAGDAQ